MQARNLICATACCVLVSSGCGSQVPPSQYFGRAFNTAAAEAPPVVGASQAPAANAGPEPVGNTISNGGGQPSGGALPSAGSTSRGSGTTAAPAGAGVVRGSCAGFRNGTGITDSTIDIANVADLSGPVPGLFTSAEQAVLAYQAYFNSSTTICGRKLKVVTYDSQTSATGDQQASTSACAETFAMVGSIGAFDSGGASTTSHCGIPDLRTISTNPERFDSPVSFGTDAVDPTQVSTAQYRFIKASTGNAAAKSAMIYLNAGAAVPNALAYKATMEHLGYHFVYQKAIGVTEFNYAPYAADLKRLGVTLVQFEGSYQFAVRLKQAMQSQGVNAVFVMDSVAYDPVFVEAGGADLDGTYSYVDTALLEEASRNPELRLYITWLHRVAPLAKPSFFGMFAWGSMALFTQLGLQLGGKLSRTSLLAAIKTVHSFTDHGLFAPQDVGGKHSPSCQAVIQLKGDSWVRRSPYPFSCSDVFDTTAS